MKILMVQELEELWIKLTVTEAEDEDIKLGSNRTRAAKEIGKNCMVMKILTQRTVILEALKKNMIMLWKPSKGMQISEIEEDLFLVEFSDGRDKKKVMEMCPWSYKKQLILMQATLTYIMNVFKLLDSLCSVLNSMMVCF